MVAMDLVPSGVRHRGRRYELLMREKEKRSAGFISFGLQEVMMGGNNVHLKGCAHTRYGTVMDIETAEITTYDYDALVAWHTLSQRPRVQYLLYSLTSDIHAKQDWHVLLGWCAPSNNVPTFQDRNTAIPIQQSKEHVPSPGWLPGTKARVNND